MTQSDVDRQRQKAINAAIAGRAPAHAWKSTVAVVVAHPPYVSQLGSGVLLQAGAGRFVVTAGHAIRKAFKHNKTIGIGTGNANIIATPGDWIVSGGDDEARDPYDTAVYLLPDDALLKLSDSTFLQLDDLSFYDPGPRAIFTLFGFPGIWTSASDTPEAPVKSKALEYTTYAYDGNLTGIAGYEAARHILLSAALGDNTEADGSPVAFYDLYGQKARFPIGLQGMSGCSVWWTGDCALPIELWQPPRMVGIQTAVYQANGVIRVSRLGGMTTLMYKAFPQFRGAIEALMKE